MSDSKVRTVTLGENAPVGVPSIEQELSKLWVEAAGTAGTTQGAVIRACALNLLVFASDQVDATHASQLVSEITSEHPSRALILNVKAEGTSGIEAQVLAHCNLIGGGAREICCEEILLEAVGDAAGGLPDAALQQISPELPVFLWWTGDPPFESDSFRKLVRASDRLVIDSSCFSNPEEELGREYELLKDPDLKAALGDLNWTRLTPWRELVAQFFDRPSSRSYLDQINKIEITFETGTPENGLQGLLLAGWLASRLDWKPEGSDFVDEWPSRDLHFSSNTGPVLVQLRRTEPFCGIPGQIHSVYITASGEPEAHFDIHCGGDFQCVTVRTEIAGENPIEQAVPMEFPKLAKLLGQELEIPGHDKIFEETLTVASQFTSHQLV